MLVKSKQIDESPAQFEPTHKIPDIPICTLQEAKLAKGIKIISEYDQEIPQSQTADNPKAPRIKLGLRFTRQSHSQPFNYKIYMFGTCPPLPLLFAKYHKVLFDFSSIKAKNPILYQLQLTVMSYTVLLLCIADQYDICLVELTDNLAKMQQYS